MATLNQSAMSRRRSGCRVGQKKRLRPADWSEFLAPEAAASHEFMKEVEDLPVQERKFFSPAQQKPSGRGAKNRFRTA